MAARSGLALLAAWLVCETALGAGRLHGTVETVGDARHTGALTWGDHRFWDEPLVAGRPLAGEPPQTEERPGFRFSLFGVRLFHDDDETEGLARFVVPFGEIRSITPDGDSAATIELRNGDTVKVRSIGADIGSRIGRIVVEAPDGRTAVPWQQVRRVQFSAGPPSVADSDRLWGTATTRAGKFTGFVRWDKDESTPGDELDGQAEGRDWSIPFGDIAAIEPKGSLAARVILKDGREVVLRGTNDVNEDSRGLEIRTPLRATVTIDWDALVRLDLASAPESPGYQRYDAGRLLRGRVRLADGTTRAGPIAWDRDETHTFETLDGETDGLAWSIPFGEIASIRPVDGRSEVRLRDGRVLTLGGSNDVDASNRGVVVEAEGTTTVLSFGAVTVVEFD